MAAGNAVVGALRVVLGADTASLEKGLKNAQSSLSKFATSAKIAGAAIAGAMAGIVGGVAVAMKNTIEQADKMGKMAQSFGVPVEELSKLKHAADLSDVSVESLGKAMGRLSKSMMEVAGGKENDVSQTFKTLGINVQNADGSLKSASAIMAEVAGKFGQMQDGAGKTAIAMQLFGRAGAELIPMLNSGKDGLQEMMTEAEQLGIVIDSKTAKAAEAFNDNLTRLGKVKDGIITQITARMLPALQQFSQMAIDAAKNSDLMASAANGIVTILKGAVEIALTAGLVFKRLGAELSALWQMLSAPNWEQMKAGWAAFRAAGEETRRQFSSLKEFIGKFWQETAANVESTAQETGQRIAAPIVVASEVVKKLAAEGDAYWNRLVAGAQRTIEMSRTPLEEYRQKIADITMQYWQGLITADQYAAAQQAVAERMGATWGQASESIAGSFADMGNAFARESKSMAMVAKVAGVVQATISMFTGAAKALELPFPANLAAMAKVLATGAGIVASIKSTAVPGFKTGGSFRVGGSGGPDSQFVPIMATPGEYVDIRRPGQGGGGDRTITVRGIDPRQYYRGDVLRDLVENLREFQRDGGQLVVA